jgi:peptide/nickel transport system substrate-binding protein
MKTQGTRDRGVTRRQFMKAGLAVGAALATTKGLAPGAWSAQPQRGGVLRISFPRAIKTLNPIKHINDAEYFQGELMYSNLCRLTTKMDAVPDLAESWEASKDATKWAFRLRKGVEFHSGGEVTAEDVVATTLAVLDPKVASPGIKNIGPIESVKALDKYTVEFACKYPYAYLPQGMAYTDIKICPKKVVEGNLEELATKDHGCGPFILKEYVPGTHLAVERNPRYFLSGKPYLEGVIQYHFPDPLAEVNALLTGQLDVVREVPPNQFTRLKEQSKVIARREASGLFINGVLGCDSPPFNDPRVRQALACCFDRELSLEMTVEGFGSVGQDTPIAPVYRHYKALPPKKRDIAKASDLLRAAGIKKGTSMTIIAANSPPTREKFAVTLKEMVKEAGLDINVQVMEYSSYLKQVWVKGNFYVGLYNMQPTEDGIFSLLYTSDAPWNEPRWNNKEFDKLVEQGRSELDPDKQKAIYGKCQEMCYEQVPMLVPVFMDLLAAHQSYVKDYLVHPRGAYWFTENVWMDKA